MSDKHDERVLVVPTKVFHDLGLFQGLNANYQHYMPVLLNPANLSFRPRSEVETDPSFKQLIPYVVMKYEGEVFHYTRGHKGSETRLRALRSIGVGGHISEADVNAHRDVYLAGMLREVEEEVYLESWYSERCLGLINDDSTPVGQVHLGIVHIFDLTEPKVRRREEVLTHDGFAPLAELRERRDEFETWSRLLFDHLKS